MIGFKEARIEQISNRIDAIQNRYDNLRDKISKKERIELQNEITAFKKMLNKLV